MRQTATRSNGLHVRAARGSGKQVPRNSVPVCVRETQSGPVPEPDRNPGENLVSEQEDQVEKTEPRGGQPVAVWLRLPGQPQPGRLCVRRRRLPPNFPQFQLRECDFPHDWCCSAFIQRRTPASLHVRRVRPADLLQSAYMKESRTDTMPVILGSNGTRHCRDLDFFCPQSL